MNTLFNERMLERYEELLRRWMSTRPSEAAAGVYPPVNIYDDGESFLVRAEVPGIRKETLDISALGDQLTIRGERVIAPADARASYHRREREGGHFRRVVTLPQRVDAEGIKASYQHGVLEVCLPRAVETRPRKITVS